MLYPQNIMSWKAWVSMRKTCFSVKRSSFIFSAFSLQTQINITRRNNTKPLFYRPMKVGHYRYSQTHHIHTHLQPIIKEPPRCLWRVGGGESEEAFNCNRAKTLQIFLNISEARIRRKICCSLNPISQNIQHSHLDRIGAQ